MRTLKEIYLEKCETESDINQHLPTLARYASFYCNAQEWGTRGVVSTWALAYGLSQNTVVKTKHLSLVDINDCPTEELIVKALEQNVVVHFHKKSTLDLVPQNNYTGLLFIDTVHVYGQLKRELAIAKSIFGISRIILHDTTLDAEYGQAIREGWSKEEIERVSLTTGIPENEIARGIWPAVEEFLVEHSQWKIIEKFENNNGLTVLGVQ